MRICPACGNQYPDDAKFCPMDASKLAEPMGDREPTTPTTQMAAVATATAATTLTDARTVWGRFAASPPAIDTPTGALYQATDLQTGEGALLLLVNRGTLPSQTMAD